MTILSRKIAILSILCVLSNLSWYLVHRNTENERDKYVFMIHKNIKMECDFMSETGKPREDQPLDAPNRDGNVWPRQRCPAFTPRYDGALNECWYCVYADFHLTMARALDVGVCYYPKKTKEEMNYAKEENNRTF